MSFANLRNGMLSMQQNEASTTDRSTEHNTLSSVDSDEELWWIATRRPGWSGGARIQFLAKRWQKLDFWQKKITNARCPKFRSGTEGPGLHLVNAGTEGSGLHRERGFQIRNLPRFVALCFLCFVCSGYRKSKTAERVVLDVQTFWMIDVHVSVEGGILNLRSCLRTVVCLVLYCQSDRKFSQDKIWIKSWAIECDPVGHGHGICW